MAILIFLYIATFLLIAHYIYLLHKEYSYRNYCFLEVTYHMEYFDEAYQTICYSSQTRVYRFHDKKRVWQEAVIEKGVLRKDRKGNMIIKPEYVWKKVSIYRAKKLNSIKKD